MAHLTIKVTINDMLMNLTLIVCNSNNAAKAFALWGQHTQLYSAGLDQHSVSVLPVPTLKGNIWLLLLSHIRLKKATRTYVKICWCYFSTSHDFADMKFFPSYCWQRQTGDTLRVSAAQCANADATEHHSGCVAKLLMSIVALTVRVYSSLLQYMKKYWKNKTGMNHLLVAILQHIH